MHIDKERIKKSWKEFMKETLKIPWTFQGNFDLDSVVQEPKAKHEGEMIILVH